MARIEERTGKRIEREKLSLIKPAKADDPIYKLGFVIGQTRLSASPK